MKKTKKDGLVTEEMLDEAVTSILDGMDNLLKEQDERNQKIFATKEDLKREVSWLRDDISGLKVELSDTPSRREFNELKGRVNKSTPLP